MMGEIKTYTDLDVWKQSRLLVKEVYILTKQFPREELFNLVSQMRRCVVSVPSNIAEGSGRNTSKDKNRFFYISRGSLFELETQLYLAMDVEYIKEDKLNEILKQIVVVKKLLNGLIRYTKSL